MKNEGWSIACFSFIFTEFALDYLDLVADLLKELSNHNERVEERKGALVELLKITREDSLAVWDEHFKTILLLLLETLGDKDVSHYLNSQSVYMRCYGHRFLL